mmetsp:Transcript_62717/g.110758  ORF Transcript_62717/g.110758 Transcript_62717/m.110758 type:complete len:210 (+) Transcript_62717:1198-1827(+)
MHTGSKARSSCGWPSRIAPVLWVQQVAPSLQDTRQDKAFSARRWASGCSLLLCSNRLGSVSSRCRVSPCWIAVHVLSKCCKPRLSTSTSRCFPSTPRVRKCTCPAVGTECVLFSNSSSCLPSHPCSSRADNMVTAITPRTPNAAGMLPWRRLYTHDRAPPALSTAPRRDRVRCAKWRLRGTRSPLRECPAPARVRFVQVVEARSTNALR